VKPVILLEDVAALLSEMPIVVDQMAEVYDAVSGSTDNGYDEEYMMVDLFRAPGAGVGDVATKATLEEYENPMRDMFRSTLENHAATKTASGRDILGGASVEAYISALMESDVQIYWPFSEEWDWETAPVITYDPEDGSEANIGFELVYGEDGARSVKEIVVTEDLARTRPVWVVNRNDDSEYTSLEMLRKNDPAWGTGGGTIVVTPRHDETKASGSGRALLLKDITLLRQLDPWFAGASEVWIKLGAVDDFTASTEAELKLYSPLITDFLVVVKRKEVGMPRAFNAMLVSNWTDQLDQCALMVVEDDGGTKTTWSCSAVVKYQSKSYGFDISIPINSRDDIIWRGNLTYNYITAHNGISGHFGDADLTFEIVEY